jgi:hypothetical protein
LPADGLQLKTKFGQSDGRCTHEQLTAHSLLDLLDGFTKRWLFDSALLRGAREAQFVTNREKIPDVLCFHDGARHEARFVGVEAVNYLQSEPFAWNVLVEDEHRQGQQQANPTEYGGLNNPY